MAVHAHMIRTMLRSQAEPGSEPLPCSSGVLPPSWNGGRSQLELTRKGRLDSIRCASSDISDQAIRHYSYTYTHFTRQRRAHGPRQTPLPACPPCPPACPVRPASCLHRIPPSQQSPPSEEEWCKERPQRRVSIYHGRTPPLDAAARRPHGQDARHPPRPGRVRCRNPARSGCSTAAASASPVPCRCPRWVDVPPRYILTLC